MAEYRRFISYLYHYRDDIRLNNVGYIRIEARNNQCKLTVHVNTKSSEEENLEVYIYSWNNTNMNCVLVGTFLLKNGVGDCKFTTEQNNVMGSNYRLDDIHGVIIRSSDGSYYGSQWDDRPIRIRQFHQVSQKPLFTSTDSSVVEESNLTENHVERKESINFSEPREIKTLYAAEILENDHVESSLENNQEDIQQTSESELDRSNTEEEVEEEAEDEVSEQDLSVQESSEQEEGKESVNYDESMIREDQSVCQEGNNNEDIQDMVSESVDLSSTLNMLEYFTTFKSCESDEEYEEIQQEIQRLKLRLEQLEKIQLEWAEYKKQKKEEEKKKAEEKLRKDLYRGAQLDSEVSSEQLKTEENQLGQTGVVNRIFEKYPKIMPFYDEDVDQCVQIAPQDIGIFPMENWILANNSFLLHGYYSYRHLIFAKLFGQNHYILGVPGMDQSRERFMAKMFGFNEFMPAKQEENQNHFGYWYMDINFK